MTRKPFFGILAALGLTGDVRVGELFVCEGADGYIPYEPRLNCEIDNVLFQKWWDYLDLPPENRPAPPAVPRHVPGY